MKGDVMDFIKNARIRIEHWITHNNNHSARYIREMTALMAQGNDCLRRALKAL